MTNDLNAKDFENIDAYFVKVLTREHNKHHIRGGVDVITNYDKNELPIPHKDGSGQPQTKTFIRWCKCMDCNVLIGIMPITEMEAKVLQNHGLTSKERTALPYIKFNRDEA